MVYGNLFSLIPYNETLYVHTVVIPVELRRTLDLDIKDPLEIYINGEQIILQKYKPNSQCTITGEVSEDNLVLANGKIVLSPQGAQELLETLHTYIQKEGAV